MKLPRIRILSPCTSRKSSGAQLHEEEVWAIAPKLRGRWGGGEEEVFGPRLARFLVEARSLYTGLHHIRVMEGVGEYRSKGGFVDLSIISAGYGVIPETVKGIPSRVVPYEATFSNMGRTRLREVADLLHIPEDARKFLSSGGCDIQLVLLGSKYLEACALPDRMDFPCTTYFFVSPSSRVPSGAIAVRLGQPEARRFSSTLVSLKGVLAKRFLSLAGQGKLPPTDGAALLDWLETAG